MSLNLAADPATQKALIATAAASGVTAWWAAAKEIALELFGVPLPVVLAAATGAFGALSFVSATTYLRTLGVGAFWTVAASFGAQLALSLIGAWAGITIPTGALAGAAILVAAAGPVLVTRAHVQKLRDAVGRLLDGVGKTGTGDKG